MAVYHVATTGNDSNVGTQTLPWRTIEKANNTLTAGDTVIIHAGTYYERIKPIRNGTAGSPITYAGNQGEIALIRGVSLTSPAVVCLGWVSSVTGSAPGHTIEFGSQDDPASYIVVDNLHISSAWSQDVAYTYPEPNYNRWHHVVIDNHASVGNVIRNCKIYQEEDGLTNFMANRRQAGILYAGGSATIENNDISGFWLGIWLAGAAPRNVVIKNNHIHDCGSSAIDIGSPLSTTIQATLVENNILGPTWNEDGVQFEPDYDHLGEVRNNGTVIRGNTFVGCAENSIDLKGAGYSVIENNIAYGSPGQDDGGIKQDWYLGGIMIRDTTGTLTYHAWNGSSYDIELINNRSGGKGFICLGAGEKTDLVVIRNNVVYDNLGGLSPTYSYRRMKCYNNTFVGNNRDYTGTNSSYGGGVNRDGFQSFVAYGPEGDNPSTYGFVFKNNIAADHHDGEISINVFGFDSGNLDADYNLYANTAGARMCDPGGGVATYFNLAGWKSHFGYGDQNSKSATSAGFVNVPARPYKDPSNYDFTLTSTSPGKSAGTHLTEVTANSTGSTIAVLDAEMFHNGYGITAGDSILIGDNSAVTVVSVNSKTSLTVNRSITVYDNDRVTLASIGFNPDMGCVVAAGAGDGGSGDGGDITNTNPPSIVSNPTSKTVVVGSDAVFNVVISSGSPVTYQWFKNGTLIPGANYSSYSVEGALFEDDGAVFVCTITNEYGAVTTSTATMTVIQNMASSNLVQNYDFSAGLSPWFFYSNDTSAEYVTKDGYIELTFGGTSTNSQLSQPGIVVIKDKEYLLSYAAKAVPSGLSMGVSLHKHATPYTNYGVNTTQVLTNEWVRYSTRFTATETSSDGRLRFWFEGYATASDVYSIGSVVLKEYVPGPIEPPGPEDPPPPDPEIPTAPVILAQPVSMSVQEGNFGSFTVVGSSTFGAISYQWYRNNVAIADQTEDTLILEGVTLDMNNSRIYCTLTNAGGQVTTDVVVLSVQENLPEYQLIVEYVDTVWSPPIGILLGYIGEVDPVSGKVLVRYFKPL